MRSCKVRSCCCAWLGMRAGTKVVGVLLVRQPFQCVLLAQGPSASHRCHGRGRPGDDHGSFGRYEGGAASDASGMASACTASSWMSWSRRTVRPWRLRHLLARVHRLPSSMSQSRARAVVDQGFAVVCRVRNAGMAHAIVTSQGIRTIRAPNAKGRADLAAGGIWSIKGSWVSLLALCLGCAPSRLSRDACCRELLRCASRQGRGSQCTASPLVSPLL